MEAGLAVVGEGCAARYLIDRLTPAVRVSLVDGCQCDNSMML